MVSVKTFTGGNGRVESGHGGGQYLKFAHVVGTEIDVVRIDEKSHGVDVRVDGFNFALFREVSQGVLQIQTGKRAYEGDGSTLRYQVVRHVLRKLHLNYSCKFFFGDVPPFNDHSHIGESCGSEVITRNGDRHLISARVHGRGNARVALAVSHGHVQRAVPVRRVSKSFTEGEHYLIGCYRLGGVGVSGGIGDNALNGCKSVHFRNGERSLFNAERLGGYGSHGVVGARHGGIGAVGYGSHSHARGVAAGVHHLSAVTYGEGDDIAVVGIFKVFNGEKFALFKCRALIGERAEVAPIYGSYLIRRNGEFALRYGAYHIVVIVKRSAFYVEDIAAFFDLYPVKVDLIAVQSCGRVSKFGTGIGAKQGAAAYGISDFKSSVAVSYADIVQSDVKLAGGYFQIACHNFGFKVLGSGHDCGERVYIVAHVAADLLRRGQHPRILSGQVCGSVFKEFIALEQLSGGGKRRRNAVFGGSVSNRYHQSEGFDNYIARIHSRQGVVIIAVGLGVEHHVILISACIDVGGAAADNGRYNRHILL